VALGATLALTLGAGCGSSELDVPTAPTQPGKRQPRLAEARRSHKTVLTRRGPSPQAGERYAPPGVELILYQSDGRELFGWLLRPTGDGPHPAILHAHGGFVLDQEDLRMARPLADAGFIVFLPTWRAENGNAGDFEMLYGEVDDALSALDHLTRLPGVDPDRVFVTGYDAGASLVMLLAEMSPRPRVVAAVGGFPDLRGAVEEWRHPVLWEIPFDWHDWVETDLRSPARYLQDLQCPLALYYADKDYELYMRQAQKMLPVAERLGLLEDRFGVKKLDDGDHGKAFDKAVPDIIELFKKR
jgi:dipeptidyl aminopeptidase/acylaminoacyl peptidase